MKIIHCLNIFWPDQIAGTELYAWALIKALKTLGIESVVVIPNYGKTVTETFEINKLKVIRYAEPSTVDRSLIMGKRVAEGVAAFVEVLLTEQASVVHFHELKGSNGLSLHHVKAAKQNGFKTMMTFHLAGYSCKTGTLMYKERELCDGVIDTARCTDCALPLNNNGVVHKAVYVAGRVLHKLDYDSTSWNNAAGTALGFPFVIEKINADLHALAGSCDRLVVYANWYKRILVLNGIPGQKVSYVAPGLKACGPYNIVAKALLGGKIRLVFVGRINAFKGIDLMIAAVAAMPADKISLDIYGHINEDEFTKKCLEAAASNSNIQFKGPLQSEVVVNVMSEYDVFCLASAFSEMSPLVIQEAFAAGLPVLASNVYGNRELITHDKNGWLFQFKNIESLKEVLRELIVNPAKVEQAKTNLPEVRPFEKVAEEYLALYNEILAHS
ncbi:MAG: glycosyltransferase [Ferruginibacter sp.]|nr:glycosyltransferase [Ferruginibacter sp.]